MALNEEKWRQELVSNIEEREARLIAADRAFQEQFGVAFSEHLEQQRTEALEAEQAWPAERRQQLQQARSAAVERLMEYANQLEPHARELAVHEAPLRVALNPEISNPSNWTTLTPGSAPHSSASESQANTGFVPRPGHTFTTPPALTREAWLRRQLEIERQRARTIDQKNAALLVAEIPFRTIHVTGSALAAKAELMGAPGASIAYDALTAAPLVYVGQQSALEATGNVAAGFVGGQYLDLAQAPPGVGTAASIVNHTADWTHQMRMLWRTRTR